MDTLLAPDTCASSGLVNAIAALCDHAFETICSYELNHLHRGPRRHMGEGDVLARLDNLIQYPAALREGKAGEILVLVNQDVECLIDDALFRRPKVL
jgi:hypothetical protein